MKTWAEKLAEAERHASMTSAAHSYQEGGSARHPASVLSRTEEWVEVSHRGETHRFPTPAWDGYLRSLECRETPDQTEYRIWREGASRLEGVLQRGNPNRW
ncbi:MAG TPA: hypothetical protein PKW90_21200 [Myxococcota bacterium]|nr:hypothetical protein [Myxococcota bacterium]